MTPKLYTSATFRSYVTKTNSQICKDSEDLTTKNNSQKQCEFTTQPTELLKYPSTDDES